MNKGISIYIYLMSVFYWSLINTELKIHGICNTSNQVIVSTRFACKDVFDGLQKCLAEIG
jgi:hypothetical protein